MKHHLLIVLLILPILIQGYKIPSIIPNYEKTWVPENYTGEYVHPFTGELPVDIGQQTHFHINISHPNATNIDNYYGTIDKPRRSLHKKETYPAGSVIHISGGPYTYTNQNHYQIQFRGEGTPENPIWIIGPEDGNVDIQVLFKISGSYMFIQDLKFNGDYNTLSLSNYNTYYVHHVVARRNIMRGEGKWNKRDAAAIGVTGYEGQTFHDILIYDNDIANYGTNYRGQDPSTFIQNDYHGVKPGRWVTRIWIFRNHIREMGGDAVQVGRAQGHHLSRVFHTYIFDNDFHDCGENSIDIKKANFTIIANNRMRGMRNWNSTYGAMIVVHDRANQTWIINNEISDGTTGSVQSDAKNSYVIGNLIRNMSNPYWKEGWYPSIYRNGNGIVSISSDGAIIGNTIINCTQGIGIKSGIYDVFNNILYNRRYAGGYDMMGEAMKEETTVHHNYIYSNIPGVESGRFKSVQCNDCVYEDPQLVDDVQATLKDTSPAIDAGQSFQYIDDLFFSIFGTRLTEDFYGNDRVVKQPDVGAYEKQCTLDASSCSFPHAFDQDQCDCVCYPPLDKQGNIKCPTNTAYSNTYCKCIALNHDEVCEQNTSDCSGGLAEDCQNGKCVQLCENISECSNPQFNNCRTTLANPFQKSCQQFECEDNAFCSFPYICQQGSCVCDTTQQCSSQYEKVNIDSCSCQCSYTQAEFPCANTNFEWDAKSCQCSCNIPTDRWGIPKCPQGQIYDAESCACYLPPVPTTCNQFVQLFSAGNNVGNYAKFFLNGVEQQLQTDDGYNIAVYDQNTYQLKEFVNFNLLVDGHSKVYKLVEYINNIQLGDYVFLAIQKDGSYKSNGYLYSSLETIGLETGYKFGWASSFALIGQKGLKSGEATYIKRGGKEGVAYLEKCLQ